MIEIRISESIYPEDPNLNAQRLSDCEKFIDGFHQLCQNCNMHNIDVSTLLSLQIITKLNFDDGTSIGIQKLFEEIGFKIKK